MEGNSNYIDATSTRRLEVETIKGNVAKYEGLDAAKDILFGSVAGMVGKLIEYPFDTVKVRLQSQPDHCRPPYDGPWDCLKRSYGSHGFFGFYRGLSAPLWGAAIETSSLFFSYRIAQRVLQMTVTYPSDHLPLSALCICGGASGAFTSLLLTPIELVKCKMQMPDIGAKHDASRTRPLELIAKIYKSDGLRGFWHGQLGTLIRETGGSAAWFGSYEAASIAFRRMDERRELASTNGTSQLPVYQQMAAGAVAGMSYNFIFYPADTVKSCMQTEEIGSSASGKRSFWTMAQAVWRQQGIRGLYRGCGITVGRAAPSSAFIFTVYEGLRHNFG